MIGKLSSIPSWFSWLQDQAATNKIVTDLHENEKYPSREVPSFSIVQSCDLDVYTQAH